MEGLPQNAIQIRYYFKDGQKSIDANVRNKTQRSLLEAINRIGVVFGINFDMELHISTKENIIDYLTFNAIGINPYFVLFPRVVMFYLTKKDELRHYILSNKGIISKEKSEQLNKKEEIIKNTNIPLFQKEKALYKLAKSEEQKGIFLASVLSKKLNDEIANKYISNFYETMGDYGKITKVGFICPSHSDDEHIIELASFKDFITKDGILVLKENSTNLEDKKATVDIIAPVLKAGQFSWIGKYCGKYIVFSLDDKDFNSKIFKAEINFISGDKLQCDMLTTVVYNEKGNENKKIYSVPKVHRVIKSELIDKKRGKPKDRQKENKRKQGLLF